MDDIERIIHERNAVCSGALLEALRQNHSKRPISKIVSSIEDVTPLPPIPDEQLSEAYELACVEVPLTRSIPGQIRTIQLAVLREFPKITMRDLFARRRERIVVQPRQIGMYLAKLLTENSLPEIGRRFGGRDHTTVLHAVRKIGKEIQDKPELAAQVERIKLTVAQATA